MLGQEVGALGAPPFPLHRNLEARPLAFMLFHFQIQKISVDAYSDLLCQVAVDSLHIGEN